MMQSKRELRYRVRHELSRPSPERAAQAGAQLCQTLLSDPRFRAAKTVLLYHALPDEVPTVPLIEAVAEQKCVLLPTVVGDDIVLHIYDKAMGTQTGAYGIEEAVGTLFPASRYGEINLALIPGMAFTRQGVRLGRGKGYYDRLLSHAAFSDLYTIGVTYDYRIFDAIPIEPHDKCVRYVLAL